MPVKLIWRHSITRKCKTVTLSNARRKSVLQSTHLRPLAGFSCVPWHHARVLASSGEMWREEPTDSRRIRHREQRRRLMRWANKQNTVNYGQRGKKKHRHRQTCQRDVWILFIIWVQHAYRARLGTGSLLMPYFCASLLLVTGRRVIQRSLEIHQFIKGMKVM